MRVFEHAPVIFLQRVFNASADIVVVVGRIEEGMSHLILPSVPLFVFLGLLIEMTGMARAMAKNIAWDP